MPGTTLQVLGTTPQVRGTTPQVPGTTTQGGTGELRQRERPFLAQLLVPEALDLIAESVSQAEP